jgi:hypothetical protein
MMRNDRSPPGWSASFEPSTTSGTASTWVDDSAWTWAAPSLARSAAAGGDADGSSAQKSTTQPSSARRTRVSAVFCGIPSASAISRNDSPSRKRSHSSSWSASGRSPTAWRTAVGSAGSSETSAAVTAVPAIEAASCARRRCMVRSARRDAVSAIVASHARARSAQGGSCLPRARRR